MDAPDPAHDLIHATSVAIHNRAALIIGPSGAGKSSLALQMIALGATLVADDRTIIQRRGDDILASAPDTIAGLIEARGVGLLSVPYESDIPVRLVVDLSREETERLPHARTHTLLGIKIPCLLHAPSPHFAAAVLLYLSQNLTQPA